MPRLLPLACLALGLLAGAERAAADGGHYRVGQTELRGGFLPRKGIHITAGSHAFTSDTLIGDDGSRLDEVTIPIFERELTLDLNVRLEATTFIATVAYVPLDLEAIGLRAGVAVAARTNQGAIDTGVFLLRSVGETDTALGDTQVTPAWLDWRWDRVRFSVSYSAWAPTGDYDPREVVNSGRGYWTQQVQATLGLFYDPEHFGGLIVRATYEIHHSATDGRVYIPGDTLSVEYGWSQELVRFRGMTFGIGVGGSSQFQVSANRVSDSDLRNLFGRGLLRAALAERVRRALRKRRSHLHAFGGELTMRDESGIAVSLVGSCDIDVESGPSGYRVGLNLSIQLGVLRERLRRK